MRRWADVAQTAERLTCNQQVAGSTPAVGSRRAIATRCCLSSIAPFDRDQRERSGQGRYGSHGAHCGSSSVGRASAFQAERRGFDSRLPLSRRVAQVAQSAEHVLGKDEVGGSIPLLGSLKSRGRRLVQRRCRSAVGEERYPSGQREQTVNLPAYAFGGSNPPLSIMRGL